MFSLFICAIHLPHHSPLFRFVCLLEMFYTFPSCRLRLMQILYISLSAQYPICRACVLYFVVSAIPQAVLAPQHCKNWGRFRVNMGPQAGLALLRLGTPASQIVGKNVSWVRGHMFCLGKNRACASDETDPELAAKIWLHSRQNWPNSPTFRRNPARIDQVNRNLSDIAHRRPEVGFWGLGRSVDPRNFESAARRGRQILAMSRNALDEIGAHPRNSGGSNQYRNRRNCFCCCGGPNNCRTIAPATKIRSRFGPQFGRCGPSLAKV